MSTTKLFASALVAVVAAGTASAAEVGTAVLQTGGVQLAQVQGAVAPRPTADPVVRQAQQALVAARFDPGPIDGVMGARTRQAIRDFQAARRLAPSGELDGATRAALGIR
jgi:peptidoglycan hydrolase-like protein with peptidoglycan-binding domain